MEVYTDNSKRSMVSYILIYHPNFGQSGQEVRCESMEEQNYNLLHCI